MNSAMAVAAGPVSERRLGTIGNEDWWAVIVGLAIVIAGLIDYALGTGVIKFLGVSPAGMKWASGDDIVVHFARLWPNYLAQFVVLTIVFGGSLRLMGRPFGEFLPSFALIYIGLLFVSTLAGWKDANYYNLEAALLALIGGLALANAVKDSGAVEGCSARGVLRQNRHRAARGDLSDLVDRIGGRRCADPIRDHLNPHRRNYLFRGDASFRP